MVNAVQLGILISNGKQKHSMFSRISLYLVLLS